MAATMEVRKLQVKSHESADEVRTPDKSRVEVVQLDGYTIGRFKLSPGWRWSECIKPIVKTEKCQLSHVGHAISGRIRVQMADGTEQTISAGESYTIPPGHDAWVDGDQQFVAIEVLSADQYAKPAT